MCFNEGNTGRGTSLVIAPRISFFRQCCHFCPCLGVSGFVLVLVFIVNSHPIVNCLLISFHPLDELPLWETIDDVKTRKGTRVLKIDQTMTQYSVLMLSESSMMASTRWVAGCPRAFRSQMGPRAPSRRNTLGSSWRRVSPVKEDAVTSSDTGPAMDALELVTGPDAEALSSELEASPLDWTAHWYAVAMTSALDPSRPNPIALLGKDLVLWKDMSTGEWRCFEDRCPHRAVPLSEGKVWPDGSLMCRCDFERPVRRMCANLILGGEVVGEGGARMQALFSHVILVRTPFCAFTIFFVSVPRGGSFAATTDGVLTEKVRARTFLRRRLLRQIVELRALSARVLWFIPFVNRMALCLSGAKVGRTV